MLSDEQRRQVAAVISNHIGHAPQSSVLRDLIGANLARDAPPWSGEKLGPWILRRALLRPDPMLFIKIVLDCDAAGTLVEVHAIVTRLQADSTAWPSTPEALWVPPEWPFVDREGLRQVLDAMAGGGGPSAITIEAPAGHGKETMTDYIRDLARLEGSFAAVVAPLQREPEPGVLDSMVADVRLALGLDFATETTHEEPERRGVVLARELAREAAAFAKSRAWLVPHVRDVSGLEPGVLRFVDELLGLVQATPATAARLRVVVLADEINLLQLTNPPTVDARFVLPEVSDTAVTAWLSSAAPGKDEEVYTLATQIVFEEVAKKNPTPSNRLAWIARQSKAAHARLMVLDDG